MNAIFVSVPEASRTLGLGLTKTYELISAGMLRSAKIGSRRLVHIDSIEELAANLMSDPVADDVSAEA